MSYTVDEQIKALEREIVMRRMVYGKKIEQGLMGRDKAEYQIGVMVSIRDLLVAKVERDREIRSIIRRIVTRLEFRNHSIDLDQTKALVVDLLDLVPEE